MAELDDNDVFDEGGSIPAAHELLLYVRETVDDWWNQQTNLTKNLTVTQRTEWLKKLFTQNEFAINRSVRIVRRPHELL